MKQIFAAAIVCGLLASPAMAAETHASVLVAANDTSDSKAQGSKDAPNYGNSGDHRQDGDKKDKKEKKEKEDKKDKKPKKDKD